MINLEKGQKIDLTKSNEGLNAINLALGWKASSGLASALGLGSLLGGGSAIDIDASAVMVDGQGRGYDLVYYGHKQSRDAKRSIRHSGDNLVGGSGKEDNETISVNLKDIPPEVERVVFVVNIYDCVNRRQNFGKVRDAFIRIYNPSKGNEEMVRYNLSGDYDKSTAIIVAALYRHNGEWKFEAIGQGSSATSVQQVAQEARS